MKTKFKIQKIGKIIKKCDIEFSKICRKCHHHLPDVNIPNIVDKTLYQGCNKQPGPQPYCSPQTCPIIKKVKELSP